MVELVLGKSHIQNTGSFNFEVLNMENKSKILNLSECLQ